MIYLIDSENVAGGWVAFALEKLSADPASRFLVMYTDGTPRLTYDETAAVVSRLSACTVFSKCSRGRSNALDFRLVAQIGIMAIREPHEHFCIVSNDQGFDEAIAAYQEAGIQATRQPCSNRLTVEPPAAIVHPQFTAPVSCDVSTEPNTVIETEDKTERVEDQAEATSDSSEQSTEDALKALHQKQRRFLSAYCSVPKMMAEAVRSALEKDLNRAEKTIRSSRSRAFGDDPVAKENAIRSIREHYGEYTGLSC